MYHSLFLMKSLSKLSKIILVAVIKVIWNSHIKLFAFHLWFFSWSYKYVLLSLWYFILYQEIQVKYYFIIIESIAIQRQKCLKLDFFLQKIPNRNIKKVIYFIRVLSVIIWVTWVNEQKDSNVKRNVFHRPAFN